MSLFTTRLTTITLVVLCARGAGEVHAARIVAGPDILVSRDGNFPHVELMVGANPRDPKNLVAGSITATRREGGTATTAYASRDGGFTWIPYPFPEQLITGGGDPQAGFSAAGTALFTTLANFRDETGRTRAALHVYRSEDGGTTWSKPANLGYSYDHEMLTVDRSVGKFGGRIYLGALWGYPVYRIGVFRSDDDGRTFIGPVEAANGGGNLGINVVNMLVLSDGTLFVPYVDFEFKPEKRGLPHSSTIWFTTSTDGAITFSAGSKIATAVTPKEPPAGRFQSFPMFAVDNRGERYRDRIYAAWNDMSSGHPRILFTYSSDRGNTWTGPKPIGSPASQSADQFQVALAVNSEGTLAVTWYDTQGFADGSAFHEYFTASTDGGETFLPEVRLSSAPSHPFGEGNMTLTPMDFRTQDSSRIGLLSAAARWANGGDYMGLCADEKGVFHPLWADARSGTYQMWTAAVRVEKPPAQNVAPNPTARLAGRVDKLVDLVYDSTHYDSATKILEIPIRLKNVSQSPIFAPLSIEVVKFGSGLTEELKENAPKLLNASNQKEGDGAVFDYTPALRDLEALEPGAISGAIVWRMKVVDPLRSPNIQFAVNGAIEK